MIKNLTVFTPTFNRSKLLKRLYNSLVNQTSKNFLWLIIDDGSSDDTRELVQKWIEQNVINIEYHYKENGGMHSAHNVAYNLIKTELNVCIDSDDFMPQDAVKTILDFWAKNKNDKVAGILGLDKYEDGSLVSTRKFPEDIKQGKYYYLKAKYGLKGDIKFVYRTDVIKKYPDYPEYKNEKFTPLGYKYLLIDQDYDMLFLNEFLCVVEYQADGSSHNIITQYFKNPKGFLAERRVRMAKAYSFKERMTNTLHYISTSIYLRETNYIQKSPKKIQTLLLTPLGILFYFYLINTKNRGWK